MLKRLSNSFSQSSDQLLLVPPPPFPTSRSAPSSPHLYSGSPSSFPFPVTTATKDDVIDRATLHKSLESLSNLVAALDQLHHASRAHNKAHKLFSKCLRDLATTTTTPSRVALSASATMFDTLAQVDMKLAKVVATEYEQLNDVVHKYFKLTARDEKQYDDHMQTIDRKLSRANVEYQKLHQSSPLLFSKHAKYVDTVQQLQTESSRLTREYAVAITTAREQIATRVARSSVELARHEWRHRVDSVKKSSTPNVLGHLSDKGLWVEHGMADVVKAAAAFNDDDKIDVEPSSSSSSRVESAIRGREADIGHDSERESQRSSALAVQDERRAGQDAPAKRASFTTRHVDQSLSSSSSSSRPSPEETVAATTSTTSRSTIPSRSSTSSPLTNSVVESTTTTLSTAEAGGGGGRTLPKGWYLDPSFASHHLEPHRSPASSRPTLESLSPRPLPPPRRIGPDASLAIETTMAGREEQQQHEAGTIAKGAETGTGGTARVVVDEGEPFRDGSVRTTTGNFESQRREGEGSFVRRMSQRFNGSPATSADSSRRATLPPKPLPSRRTSQPVLLPASTTTTTREGGGGGVGFADGEEDEDDDDESQTGRRRRIPPQQTHHHSSESAAARSNSRVSLLAKRYSSPPPVIGAVDERDDRALLSPSSERFDERPPRALCRPAVVAPLSLSSSTRLPSYTSSLRTTTRQQQQLDPPPPPPPARRDPGRRDRDDDEMIERQDQGKDKEEEEEAHPSMCACESCTLKHYSNPARAAAADRPGLAPAWSREDEEALQKTLRTQGGGGGGKGATLIRGFVGKSKEVFGRMG